MDTFGVPPWSSRLILTLVRCQNFWASSSWAGAGSVIERNSERWFGKAPVKEDVGVFITDIVVKVRKLELCVQHDGPSRLNSSLRRRRHT